MLTYGGLPLLLPTTGMCDWVAKNIPQNYSYPWVERSWPGSRGNLLTVPLGPTPLRPVEINKLVWPTGATRWGYMSFLASTEMVDQLKIASYGNEGEESELAGLPLVLSNSNGGEGDPFTITINTMYMLPPTPLSGVRMVNGLYLVTVVDLRYFWQYLPVPYDEDDPIVINCGNDDEDPTSWSDFITALFTAISPDLEWEGPEVPESYFYPNAQLNLTGVPISQVLDAAVYNIGCRLVANWDGSYMIQVAENENLGDTSDAISAHENNLANFSSQIKAGGEMLVNEEEL